MMFRGIAYALGACLIWGLIFIIPQFMHDFTSFEIALGRYLVYGILSAIIFLRSKSQGTCQYRRAIWIKALYFSLVLTIGYYTFVILAMRYSTPATTVFILSTSPIIIAFYGNWQQRETSFKTLMIPSALILLGLALINIPHLEKTVSLSSYILGLGFSLLALIGWSWYVVANSRFLKHHPEVLSSDWSTLIGVAALFWVVVFSIILAVFFENQLQLDKYFTNDLDLINFFIGSAILGLLCSWVGAFLWNKASLHLPVSLAGQLTIFETIFGALYIYILQRNMPTTLESIGIAILLIAIIYGIRQFAKNKPYDDQIKPH